MYKSVLEVFSEKQIEFMRTRMWWVAQQTKPYLVKYASYQDFALLQLTDLRSLWVGRIHLNTLIQQKSKYAKSLQIKQRKDLLTLFQSLLTATDHDPGTHYTFKEIQPSELQFSFKKMIKIFDFNWTFKLKKVNCNPVQLICRELLTPLSSALQAQSNRFQSMKKKFQVVEKDYIRKMTEMERNLYRSPLIEDHQEWQQFLPKYQGTLLKMGKPDQFTCQCFSNFISAGASSRKKQKQSSFLISQHYPKQQSSQRMPRNDRFQQNDAFLFQQLERQRPKKKDKVIDFI